MLARIKKGTINYFQDLRQLTPNARKYLLGSFFISMTFSSLMLLLNLYLRERGFGEADIGSVLSSGALGMVCISIPGAFLISRVRLKPILLISTILFVIFGLITVYAQQLWAIKVAYFFAGAAMTFYRIASAPFFMRNSGPRERPYLFSLSFGIAVIAGVIGSFIFGGLVEFLAGSLAYDSVQAHRFSLAVGVLLSLLALIPFTIIKMPKQIPLEDRLEFSLKTFAPFKGLFLKLAAPYFIVGTGAGMIIPFLNIFFRDRFSQDPDEIGLFFGLAHLTMFIGVMAGPIMVKKIGMVRTMVYTQLLSIPFMLILAFSYYFPLVIAAFLIRGALMNLGHPIGNNFAMEMVPKSMHAIMNALLMFAWTSSWMISTKIGGMVIETHGYTQSLVIAVILYVISSVMYYMFFRKAEKFTLNGVTVKSEFKSTA
ncbi:MAG: MFS transporter [candidate division Zixibacteria bacterium]